MKKDIEELVKDYYSKNPQKVLSYNDSPTKRIPVNHTKTISADELISGKYLSEITNPFDKSKVNNPEDIVITVGLNSDYTANMSDISITSESNTWIGLSLVNDNWINRCDDYIN